MPDVHPIANAGFASAAERYEKGRPGYPVEAVTWMLDRLGLGSRPAILDVAAGTGKLTRLLEAAGCRVTAAEPVREMTGVLNRISPAVPVVNATAQHLPFQDASFSAVTAAQALHWFNEEAVWLEFARIIRPGGGVGLIWNARDRSVEWVDHVWTIMDNVEKHAPWRNHDRPQEFRFGRAKKSFGGIESAQFTHEVTVTPEEMVDRVASVSHVAVLSDARRRAVLDDVRSALPNVDRLKVPYRVDVFAIRRT